MKFWGRVYRERRAIVLPLLVFLVANVAVLAFVVAPLKRAVTNDDQARIDAMGRLGDARRADTAARRAKSSKEQADVELKKFYGEILPGDFAAAERLTRTWLNGVASSAGVQFQAGKFSYDAVKDSRLVRFTGKVTLNGDYAAIRRFLYDVETAEQFVIIEKVSLEQSDTRQARGSLEVALDVATYFLSNGATSR